MSNGTLFSLEINPQFERPTVAEWEKLKQRFHKLAKLEKAALHMDSKCAGHIELRRFVIDVLTSLVGNDAEIPYLKRQSVADIVESNIWKAFHQEVPKREW